MSTQQCGGANVKPRCPSRFELDSAASDIGGKLWSEFASWKEREIYERERGGGERERSDILITGIITMKLRVITDYERVERPVTRNFTRECILSRAPSYL